MILLKKLIFFFLHIFRPRPCKIEYQAISSNNISKEYKRTTVTQFISKHELGSFKVAGW